LRLRGGIFVCEEQGEFWLAGEELNEELELELRKLPGARRFAVQDGSLIPDGDLLTSGQIPDGDWQPLSAWVVPVVQPAALAGELQRRVPLRLQRSGHEEPASVLVTSLQEWLAYATTAPLVRLRPLHFAACDSNPSSGVGSSVGCALAHAATEDHRASRRVLKHTLPETEDEERREKGLEQSRVIIRGTPLPPIAGRRYFERDGIALPCGFELQPAVDATVLQALLQTSAADLVIFDEDGSCQRVNAEDFVAASRSAVRATAEALGV